MFTKEQVEYRERPIFYAQVPDEECQNCRHFEIHKPRGCEIVEGEIKAAGYCIMWSNKQRKPDASNK